MKRTFFVLGLCLLTGSTAQAQAIVDPVAFQAEIEQAETDAQQQAVFKKVRGAMDQFTQAMTDRQDMILGDDAAQETPASAESVACAMDVQVCPDGSSVGRNPANNCEFDPCPLEMKQ